MTSKELEPILLELSRPENLEALKEVVDKLPTISYTLRLLEELTKTGALETLVRLACMVGSIKDMLSDEMVAGASSLTSSAIEVVAKTKSPIVQNLLSALADHPKEFQQELEKTKIKGIWSLVSVMKDPDVQRGMSILIVMMKMLGRYGSQNNRE